MSRSGKDNPMSRIKTLAKQLNRVADEANARIDEVETELQEAGIGLEVWLESTPLKAEDYAEADFDGLKGEYHQTSRRTFTEIGFARIPRTREWQLAVREQEWTLDSDGDLERLWDSGTVIPLREASRDIRLLAVPLLDRLVEEIAKEAEKLAGGGEDQ